MLRVLLVDDEPFILEGVQNIIEWEKYGFEIAGIAENGVEALDFIEQNEVDILITDITMPNMGGLQLIERVKEIKPFIKFIILSGYDEFDYIKKGMKLGIENYLLKPISIQELVSTLKEVHKKINENIMYDRYFYKDRDVLKRNILIRWITNRIDTVELRERLKLIGIDINSNSYIVSVIRTLNDSSDNRCEEKQRFDKLSMIFKTIVKVNNQPVWFYDMDDDIVVIFIDANIENKVDDINELLSKFGSTVKNEMGLDLSISISDFADNYQEVHSSYINAKKMQEYRLVMPNQNILEYGEIQNRSSVAISIEIDYHKFFKLIASQNQEGVNEYIDQIIDNILKSKNYSSTDVQNTFMELIAYTKVSLKSYNANECILTDDYKELFTKILLSNDIDQLRDLIKSFVSQIITKLKTTQNSYSPVVKQVIDHVKREFNGELQLKTLAYSFRINPTYLGQLFQKETGKSFSKFVYEYRMNMSRKLLLETNLKIMEIAEKVGYTDITYFYKQFKKFYNVKPSEFRSYK